ncbi:DUF1972 domain-containing protein [Rhodococcus erythropolis]|uniref:DUF1972 domain-containing protein n=1 Tax=Rhodococcus erythropolis TaxID=1833 RepID=UPI0008A5D373|nr:DUF1972 domain-containing protein [Rhodococcus erythropolis]MBT1257655.1 DUF1972 domain-containing protein [Rhodococcus erythropolis]OHF27124.1 glycosyl transferase [Rhodococcus erythropolis]ORI28524.1 glycosyl transferase [Rhodococcus erythropolis]
MRIAMIGTRGVPARYGGFETAVEEIGSRLVEGGHEVVVYCRGKNRSPSYRGMERIPLPALKHPILETLSHTALSVGHLLRHRCDAAIVFNAANAPLLPAIRAARIPVAVHVDGLEWKRGKWGPVGRRYYLVNERVSVWLADELISDAEGIADYYRERYDTPSMFLPYGAPIRDSTDLSRLSELDLTEHGYHLVVARLEPENQVDRIIEGYLQSDAQLPLIVVGSVPYESEHEKRVNELAASDSRIRQLGGVWDQDLLDTLYAGAASYLHGHTVGGTNPSLLRAMGAGANVIAWDVNFNREVLGDNGVFFNGLTQLSAALEETESDPTAAAERGLRARAHAAATYRWDEVTKGYEQLCEEMRAGTRSRKLRKRPQDTVQSQYSVGRNPQLSETHSV